MRFESKRGPKREEKKTFYKLKNFFKKKFFGFFFH